VGVPVPVSELQRSPFGQRFATAHGFCVLKASQCLSPLIILAFVDLRVCGSKNSIVCFAMMRFARCGNCCVAVRLSVACSNSLKWRRISPSPLSVSHPVHASRMQGIQALSLVSISRDISLSVQETEDVYCPSAFPSYSVYPQHVCVF
jgi:hypothetical protein